MPELAVNPAFVCRAFSSCSQQGNTWADRLYRAPEQTGTAQDGRDHPQAALATFPASKPLRNSPRHADA
jgi:hypothetical protein